MTSVRGSYAAWVSWLEAFGRGEDMTTQHLPAMGEAIGPDMQERLIGHVAAAFNHRWTRWEQQFQRDQEHARNPVQIAAVLSDSRRRLAPLARLARMTQLDERLRIELAKSLTDRVTQTQQGLEKSVRHNAVTERLLLGVVLQNSLLHGLTSAAVAPSSPDRPAASPAPAGRRIIR